MSREVWYLMPTKKAAPAAQECIDAWRGLGYRVGVWRDRGDEPVSADLVLVGAYPGYARSMNSLAAQTDSDWVVIGGDDIFPDTTTSPGRIAAQLTAHFNGTFGVMQPTGERWGDANGAYIDRVAGSPWIGRAFIKTTYNGNGPYWPEYTHMFVDEELQQIAIMAGCFLQRKDLTHTHRHWARTANGMPDYLRHANSPAHWKQFSELYQQRRAEGFPGALQPDTIEIKGR